MQWCHDSFHFPSVDVAELQVLGTTAEVRQPLQRGPTFVPALDGPQRTDFPLFFAELLFSQCHSEKTRNELKTGKQGKRGGGRKLEKRSKIQPTF